MINTVMKYIMELLGDTPEQDFTPLQQDNSPGVDDLMTIPDDQSGDVVRLSQAQKFILTKLMVPDVTPLMAYEQTSNGRNIVANRETLEKLGMVEMAENSAIITDKGKEALTQEGLLDDSGMLTPQGEQYANAADLAAVGEIAAQQKGDLQGMGTPTISEPPADAQMNDKPAGSGAPMPDTGTSALESWAMISDSQADLSEKHFMRKHGKKL